MQEEYWEKPVCFLCNHWLLILILLLLLAGLIFAAYYTRDIWSPMLFPTQIPVYTSTPFPTSTWTITPLPTVTATSSPAPTQTIPPTATLVLGTGDVQVTLTWETSDDLDLWVTDPDGEKIFYSNKLSSSGGELDVDANHDVMMAHPVENIFWPIGAAPEGNYIIQVNFFRRNSTVSQILFHVRLKLDGEIQEFDGILDEVSETVLVTEFVR